MQYFLKMYSPLNSEMKKELLKSCDNLDTHFFTRRNWNLGIQYSQPAPFYFYFLHTCLDITCTNILVTQKGTKLGVVHPYSWTLYVPNVREWHTTSWSAEATHLNLIHHLFWICRHCSFSHFQEQKYTEYVLDSLCRQRIYRLNILRGRIYYRMLNREKKPKMDTSRTTTKKTCEPEAFPLPKSLRTL